jgi:hypothetical protein
MQQQKRRSLTADAPHDLDLGIGSLHLETLEAFEHVALGM